MGKGYWKMEATLKIAKETVLAKDEEIFALKAHARRREESFDEERLSFSEESAAKDEKIAAQQNDLAALSNDYMRIKRRGIQDSQMLKVSDEQLGICEARLAEVSHLGELERLDAEAFSGLEHLAGLEVGLLEDEIGLLEAHEADHLEEMTAVRADCEEDISAIGFLADLAEEDHLVELDEAERVNKDIKDENEILVAQLTAVEFLAAEEVKEVEEHSEALLAAGEHLAQLEQEDVLEELQEVERAGRALEDENEILVAQFTAVEFLAAEEVKEVEEASEALLAAGEHLAQLEQEDVLEELQEVERVGRALEDENEILVAQLTAVEFLAAEEVKEVEEHSEALLAAGEHLAQLEQEDVLEELQEVERAGRALEDENEILVAQFTAVEFLAAEEVKEVEEASEALLAAGEHLAQLEQEDVLNEQQEGFEGLLQATNQLAQWETDLLTLATGRAERLLGELELARVNTLRLTEELVESNQIKAELQLQEVVREDRKKLLTAEACRNAGLRKRRRDDDDDHRGGDRQRRRHADRDHQDANQELRLRLRDRQAEGYYA